MIQLAIGFSTLLGSPSTTAQDGLDLLRSVAEAHDGLQTLRADYVQRRSSALVRRPLTSRGALIYRRSSEREERGVLRLETERTVVRVTGQTYQVWRKEDGVVEEAPIPESNWSRFLFDAVGHRLDQVLDRFSVERLEVSENGRAVVLKPRATKDAERVRQVRLQVDPNRPELKGLAYTTTGGDRVEIALEGVQRDPELAEAATDLGAPKGVRRVNLPKR